MLIMCKISTSRSNLCSFLDTKEYTGDFSRNSTGKYINTGINAAYQIMKAGGEEDPKVKEEETITRINVS